MACGPQPAFSLWPALPEPTVQSLPGLQNADIAESPARAEKVRKAKRETGSFLFPPKCNPRSSKVVLRLEDPPKPATAKMLRDAGGNHNQTPTHLPCGLGGGQGIVINPGGP